VLATNKSESRHPVLAEQALGIKEVEEGIWLVSFMEYVGSIPIARSITQRSGPET
jgi:hypothetical protein